MALKLSLRLGVAAFALALLAGINYARESPGGTPSCGLGLPPDAPGFAEAEARIALESKQKGYQQVCDANLERYRIRFQPLAATLENLAFQPVDLSRTPFARFRSLGALPERSNGRHTGVYRGFRTTDGHKVTLFEQDMSVDGISRWRDPKDEPERINGLPARLDVFHTPAGKALSLLSWVEGRRDYQLWIDTSVANTPARAQLFALAASLPASVPACPGEVPPQPVRIGHDGLPIHEMPLTLPIDEDSAAPGDGKRACK
ncbi:hypothetical protein GCM10007386_27540 [Pseudoduganella dura]|nr:hypothetical protein GCM10007386_27540 [Pseudoduganella dura]